VKALNRFGNGTDGVYADVIGVNVMVVYCIVFFLVTALASAQQISKAATDQSPFMAIPPAIPDTLRFEAQIPDFEAKDTEGRVWRSADLRGKFTVIDIWSTFGGVRNEQHAELQRFYANIKTGGNIQVLTFCTDFDYKHAPVYMRQNRYTFRPCPHARDPKSFLPSTFSSAMGG
jgi:hypothetical protein